MANNALTGFDSPGRATAGDKLAQMFHGVEANLFSDARFGNPNYVGRYQTSEEEIVHKISDAYNDGDLR